MPLYLADTVLHLHYLGFGEYFDRTIHVVKHRGSNHAQGLYPYSIERGMGLVVQASESDINKLKPTNEYKKEFSEAIKKAKNINPKLARRIKILSENWVHEENPEPVLEMMINYEKK